MPLNLTHCTFKNSHTSVMASVIVIINTKSQKKKKIASIQNLANEGVLLSVLLEERDKEKLLSADTSLEWKRTGRVVLSKQGSTPDVSAVHKALGERNISLLAAVYFSALLCRGHPITDRSAEPAGGRRGTNSGIKRTVWKRGEAHLICLADTFHTEVLSVFPLLGQSLLLCGGESDWSPRRLP